MSNAKGADPIQQKAAADANAVQDACNLVAIVGCFHRHLLALHRSGVCGDDLINHPVSLSFISKLNSLCRMTLDRECAALAAIDLIEVDNGALAYAVLPTRGMGLWQGNYRGLNLGWKAPVHGPVHPRHVNTADRGGIGWLTGFD